MLLPSSVLRNLEPVAVIESRSHEVCFCGHALSDHDQEVGCLVDRCQCDGFFGLSTGEGSIILIEVEEGRFFGDQFDINPWIPPESETQKAVVVQSQIGIFDHEFSF